MQPNLAKFEDLQALLNMINNRFVHEKESFPPSKGDSALQTLQKSQKAQN